METHPLTWVWAICLGVSLHETCQHPGLQSPGTLLVSALLLALILMHFIPSSTQMCCPVSFLPKPTAVIKASWPLFCLHVPHHPLHSCGWKGENTIRKDLPPAAESKLSVEPLLSHLKEDGSNCQWYTKYLKGCNDLGQSEKWIPARVVQRQDQVRASSSLSQCHCLLQVDCKRIWIWLLPIYTHAVKVTQIRFPQQKYFVEMVPT